MTTPSVKDVIVVGNGAWGNALLSVMQSLQVRVKMWDRTSPLNTAHAVVLAVPTIAIRQILTQFPLSPSCIIINTSKGVEKDTHLLPYQIVRSVMKNPQYFTLIGPSFAKEVVNHTPTVVNIGYRFPKHGQYVKHLFHSKAFHVHLTKDVEVLELFAALKNVYAIASGMAHGLGLMANTQAKLTVLALEELYRMMRKLNLTISSRSLAGTVGDLVLTTYSEESRNFRFGKALINSSSTNALALVSSTVEGYSTAFSVNHLANKHHIQLPLAQLVYDIIVDDDPKKTKAKFTRFLEEV